MAHPRRDARSEGDYLHWPDDERWELNDGLAYDRSPAPTRRQQDYVLEIAVQASN